MTLSSSRVSGEPEDPVVWRDGIHLARTSIWCDAKRSRDLCFVSSAQAISTARHGQLLATTPTLAMLERSDGTPTTASQLAMPYGRPCTLGTLRLETFASGHCLGSASLLLHMDNTRIVYAGIVSPRGSALGGAMDARSADVLVINGRFGQPEYRFPSAGQAQTDLDSWCRPIVSRGGIAVVLVPNLGFALDIAAFCETISIPCSAARGVVSAHERLQKRNIPLPPLARFAPRKPRPGVLLWLTSQRTRLLADDLPPGSDISLLSECADVQGLVSEAGATTGIRWANQADFADLLQYIDSSHAQQVYVTHSPDNGAALKAAFPDRTIEALGPPQQLALFC